MKKYNFNAGPSMLPREVIEATAKQCLDFNGSGLSLMEISHRAKDFQPVVDEAVALVKELLDVPEGYSVIFLGGGASLEFCMIPFNFLIKKAAYLNTGVWAKKAMKEAKLFGEVVEVASSADANYTFIPKGWTVPADADYLHITTNNTIYGTEIRKDLDVNVPMIADMSSDFMSRPVDVSKYDAIYAGAQKNLSMAGVTIIIVKDEKLGKAPREIPTMLDYRTHVDKGSMFRLRRDRPQQDVQGYGCCRGPFTDEPLLRDGRRVQGVGEGLPRLRSEQGYGWCEGSPLSWWFPCILLQRPDHRGLQCTRSMHEGIRG